MDVDAQAPEGGARLCEDKERVHPRGDVVNLEWCDAAAGQSVSVERRPHGDQDDDACVMMQARQ